MEYDYEIEYEYDFWNLASTLSIIMSHTNLQPRTEMLGTPKEIGSITSRCSGNEPVLLLEGAAEIEPTKEIAPTGIAI